MIFEDHKNHKKDFFGPYNRCFEDHKKHKNDFFWTPKNPKKGILRTLKNPKNDFFGP